MSKVQPDMFSHSSPKEYNYNELQNIKRNISKLDKTEQLEILKIIKQYNDRLTENKNGVFINLCNVSNSCLEAIDRFVKYSLENRERLLNLEKLSENIFKDSLLKKQYENFKEPENIKGDKKIDEEPLDSLDNSSNNVSISNNSSDNSNSKHLSINDEIEIDDDNNDNDDNDDDDDDDDSEIIKPQGKIENTNKVTTSGDEALENIDLGLSVDFPSKKNKFTGRNARIMKKCKELTRSYHSESNFYGLATDIANISDEEDLNDDDDDEKFTNTEINGDKKEIITNDLSNELTEEII